MLSKIRDVLNKNRIALSKYKSQNFIINTNILTTELKAGEINKNDEVVEIGAGIGTLTKLLAQNARKVIAIEKDKKFIEILNEELSHFDNIEIINEDILKINSEIFENRKIISNPPYNISSPLVVKILESSYKLCVMTLQYEFARRLIAKPGSDDYSRLTVKALYNADIELLNIIDRRNFYPAPKVNSVIIRITPKRPTVELENEELYFKIVNYLFNHKNQQVQKVLKNKLRKAGIEIERIYKIIENLPHNNLRIRDLNHDQLKEIVDYLTNSNEDLKQCLNI